MNKTNPFPYEAPAVEVIETRFEGVICDSYNTVSRNSYDSTNDNPFE